VVDHFLWQKGSHPRWPSISFDNSSGARFPANLPEFFINMLTEPGDLVLDIFAGSNTTGQVAQSEKQLWLAFELSSEYVVCSAFRFLDK
jgi:DNA modification methylase